jgi:hypothetical protein
MAFVQIVTSMRYRQDHSLKPGVSSSLQPLQAHFRRWTGFDFLAVNAEAFVCLVFPSVFVLCSLIFLIVY